MTVKAPKKLIEVALPLDDINVAAAREKSIRHGHPSTLHLWWARRPLAAARAVLFAQLVNDPGYERHLQRGVNKEEAQLKREELFDIIRELVQWENTNNERVLERARKAIWESWRETCALNRNHPQAAELFNPEKLPAFHDPFAGGGAIPLEAQRLGLESYASDLNPVAVLINKAMIEIPPKFAGRAPVGPIPPGDKQAKLHNDWSGAKGLAEDVRRYGHWMREEAFKRIGHLYPQVEITPELAEGRPDLKPLIGQKLTVIAWLWARTVKSPNPAFRHADVPLTSTFILSAKKGKEAYVEPVVEGSTYRFVAKPGVSPDISFSKNGTKLARGANFRCLLSGAPIEPSYIKSEGVAGRMGTRLMAIVAEGPKGRVYLSPTEEIEGIANQAKVEWRPTGQVPSRLTGGTCYGYGLTEWGDLFTSRQLLALTTFTDLVEEIRKKVKLDALKASWEDDDLGIEDGGSGAAAYADAVAVYLAFQIDQLTNHLSTICAWHVNNEQLKNTFARQSLPMTWDFAETNPFSSSTGSLSNLQERQIKGFGALTPNSAGQAFQADAKTIPHLHEKQTIYNSHKIISTDPPYYDNIAYADLSDFFYVWARRSLKSVFPSLFNTLATPKAEELVAAAYRHGGRERAEAYFLEGMLEAMRLLSKQNHPSFPVTIYYAFKQSETGEKGTASTGWETFLAAVIQSGFWIGGTWPIRTEQTAALKTGLNMLASSIVLVCRKREANAASISRKEFVRELKEVLPEALEVMTGVAAGSTDKGTAKQVHSPIAPVDLAQAAIGPGMAVYSRYAAVLEADGNPMDVRTALTLINKAIDEYFSEAEGDLDADSRFCIEWFSQFNWSSAAFGQADVLARAKGTSVDGLQEAGVLVAGAGKVRLLKVPEYAPDWNPTEDNRTPVWQALHQLIRALRHGEGETAAGELLAYMPERAEPIRQLAYRLFTLCERHKWAEEARAYNELITAWHGIEKASYEVGRHGEQTTLALEGKA